MDILFVGGTFDDNGGRSSSVVDKFFDAMCRDENIHYKDFPNLRFGLSDAGDSVHCANGGTFKFLQELLKQTEFYDCVIWWANVPNDKPKLRDVKAVNPKTILVTSKRNDGGKYSFQELINRSLAIKANLTIEFSKSEEGKFKMMLFDPLGNCWHEGFDIEQCANAMLARIKYLLTIRRKPCTRVEAATGTVVPDNPEFFELIKEYAEVLHELIMPAEGVTRFLGNTSFRCMRGFPSFRANNTAIYVSRRNVDKRYIDKDAFVLTKLVAGNVYYYGENKPSVDTPIQLNLYTLLPNINFMFHSHVYIEDAPFTNTMVPCGGMQEVAEILDVIHYHYDGDHNGTFYAINLIGHGSIVMCNDVEQLKNIKFERRPMPELQYKEE